MNGFTPEDLQRVIDIKNTTTDLKSNVRDINKELRLQGELTVNVSTEFSNINSSTSKFVALQKEAQQSSSATAKAIREQTKQQNVVKTLNIQIDDLYRRSRKTNDATAKILVAQASALSSARDSAQTLASSYYELAESSASIDGNTMWFSSLSEFVKDIPGLRKLSGPFDAAAKASRQTVLSNAKSKAFMEEALKTGKGLTTEKLKELKLTDITGKATGTSAAALLKKAKVTASTQNVGIAGLKAGFKSLGPIITKALGPLALLKIAADVAKFFWDAMIGASKATADMSRNMLISRESARELYTKDIPRIVDQYNLIAKAQGETTITQESYIKGLNTVNSELGFQLDLTRDFGDETAMNVAEVAKMQNNFGLSAKASTQLFLEATATNKPLKDINKSIFSTLGLMSAQSGLQVDINKTIEEAVGITGNMRANFGYSTESIAKAVFQAKLLGLSLSQADGISSSLLDFQSSIESEMEAELMLGRSLNLEEARRAALMGDTETLMAEISQQAGSQEDFLKMNIYQRQTLAKAVGLEVNALADMYKERAENDALAEKSLELQNKFRVEGKSLLEDGFDIKTASLSQIRIAAQKAGKSEEELRDILGEQIYLRKQEEDATQKFAKAMQQVKEAFMRLVDGGMIDKLADGLEDLLSGPLFDGAVEKLSEEEQNKVVAKRATGNIQQDIEFAKQLQIANQTQGMFGLSSEFSRNGINTNAEIRAAREFVKTNEVDDFILRPGQAPIKFNKDDLLIGGTNLNGGGGGNVEMILNKILTAVEGGGDVYMDGAKVGKSLALATSRMG